MIWCSNLHYGLWMNWIGMESEFNWCKHLNTALGWFRVTHWWVISTHAHWCLDTCYITSWSLAHHPKWRNKSKTKWLEMRWEEVFELLWVWSDMMFLKYMFMIYSWLELVSRKKKLLKSFDCINLWTFLFRSDLLEINVCWILQIPIYMAYPSLLMDKNGSSPIEGPCTHSLIPENLDL